jgi:hypothetical protein
MSGVDVRTAPATLAVDMAGALLESVVSEVDEAAEHAVLVQAAFHDAEHEADAGVFFLPGPDGLESLLTSLGLV